MIKYDFYNEEHTLVVAKSDFYMIHKIGTSEMYSEAIDWFDHIDPVDGKPRGRFRYEETDEPLPQEPTKEEVFENDADIQ